LAVAAFTFACTFSRGQTASNVSPIPLDSSVTTGRLDNGLKYYIQVNRKPEKRAEIRLAVNAGSVLEDDDQVGLAHFTEHMAFNGTAHFPKQELVYFLESIGMSFGPEINAYTNFDETVYMLEVPTDTAGVLDKAFLILEDWARGIRFDPAEIQKERGVVIEEWRLGRGAEARMQDKQYPVLFKGSRYADRLPIGKKEILETFKPEALKRFYGDWYRPDLMAVVAVGDFDLNKTEDMIRAHFGNLPASSHAKERKVFPVPDHKETLFSVESDPEATGSEIDLYFLGPLLPDKTLADYRRIVIENLYDTMMNQRLYELTKRPDPPFLYALSGKGRFVRSKGVYYLGAGVKDNGIERGLKTLLTEVERVRRYGFIPSEFDRAKSEVLRGLEKAFSERGKTESRKYASELVRNAMTGEPDPGVGWEFETTKKIMPDIRLEEINRLPAEWMTDSNRVVLVNLPQKEGVRKPAEAELSALFRQALDQQIEPYHDDALDRPLVAAEPQSGRITGIRTNPKLGTTEWTLSNGVRVVLKPTDFKNDEIRFSAYSPGGNSLVSEKNEIAAMTAVSAVKEGGAGAFNAVQLDKRLTGKMVGVSPSLGMLTEGISGSASPKDAETMFQLIYLYMTAPRKDNDAFSSYRDRLRGMLENRSKRPESAFQDTLQVVLAQHHRRARPWSVSMLDEMNLDSSYAVYQDRFADADDFTFFFVGTFRPDSLKSKILTWLGGLPSRGRKESWKDLGIRPPGGIIEKTVRKGIEPKSRAAIVFTGPWDWTPENNYRFESMAGFLRIRMREVLREDMGGTYGVSVSPSTAKYPDQEYSLSISFGCSPDRVEDLVQTVFRQIDSLKTFGPKPGDLAKVKEIQRRDFETDVKQNGFWLNSLSGSDFNRENPDLILDTPNWIRNLSVKDVQKTARRVFNMDRYVKVVLLPEGAKKK
jgi:zinc protease